MTERNQIRAGMIGVVSVGFIDCIAYGVIMPSLWEYLQTLGGSTSELGFALSAFSLAQLLAFPLIGIWADRRSIKVSTRSQSSWRWGGGTIDP